MANVAGRTGVSGAEQDGIVWANSARGQALRSRRGFDAPPETLRSRFKPSSHRTGVGPRRSSGQWETYSGTGRRLLVRPYGVLDADFGRVVAASVRAIGRV